METFQLRDDAEVSYEALPLSSTAVKGLFMYNCLQVVLPGTAQREEWMVQGELCFSEYMVLKPNE